MSTTAPKINPRALTFGRQLRAAMLQKQVSSRELGRRLAHENLTSQAARRTIMKYLRGEVLPSPERRDELADALGVKRDRLTVEDEEEADLYAILFAAFQAIARHEARREIYRDHRAALEEPPSELDRERRRFRAADALPPGGSSSAVTESTALDRSQAGPTGHTPSRASQSAQTKGR